MRKLTLLIPGLLLITLVGCYPETDEEQSASRYEPVVVFAVRHGEKADLSEDAELSVAGEARAVELARILRSAKIDYVHASPFVRTRNTAAPTAAAYGVAIQVYDPHDLPGLIEKIRKTGGRHLVVGHSNTTSLLAELLTGETSTAINEEGEFDRLYVLTVGQDGEASGILMRYGEPYIPVQNN